MTREGQNGNHHSYRSIRIALNFDDAHHFSSVDDGIGRAAFLAAIILLNFGHQPATWRVETEAEPPELTIPIHE